MKLNKKFIENNYNFLKNKKMRRRHRWDYDENQPEDQYTIAKRRVNRLKRFYKHIMIYVVINIFIIATESFYFIYPGQS